MAISEFHCSKCNVTIEHLRSVHEPVPAFKKCPKCGGRAQYKASLTNVSTQGMSNSPIDVAIGRDAEARWADIKKRQEIRNKVRRDSGEQAVRMTGRNEFRPIQGGKRELVVIPERAVGFDNKKDARLAKK